MHIDIHGNKILIKRKYDAQYHLYDIVDGLIIQTRIEGILASYGGSTVTLLPIYYPALGVTGLYIERNYNLTTIARLARVGIARIQYGMHLTACGTGDEKVLLQGAFKTAINKTAPILGHEGSSVCLWDEVLSANIVLPYTRVSATHLRHVAMHELEMVIDRNKKDTHNRLALMEGLLKGSITRDMHESAFIGIALWLLSLDDKLIEYCYESDIFMRELTLAQWQREMKELSLRLKSLQNIVSINLTQCFEIDVLVNRGIGEVDWTAERANRSTRLDVTNHKYEDIFEEASRLFTTAKLEGNRPERMKWDVFQARRWEWSPTGAYHSQYEEDLEGRPKQRELRNKLYMHTLHQAPHFKNMIDRPPCARAWPSTKYEWGKMRAIYGVDDTNFTMSSFGFIAAEKCMPSDCPIGERANDDYVTSSVEAALRGLTSYCLDFSDFNSQHSVSSMCAVIDAYLGTYYHDLEEEQIEAVRWTRDALMDMEVMSSEGRSSYVMKGTLLSGWRLTTFMNTALNRIYIKLASKGLLVSSLHSGDDVLMGVKTLGDVFTLNKELLARNARLQDSKCFLGGIAEFLRVDRVQATMSQYLPRSIATLVHGPTESIIPNNLSAILESVSVRINEAKERGGKEEIMDKLKEIIVKRICNKWDIDYKLILEYMSTHRSVGGMSNSIEARVDKRFRLREIKLNEHNTKRDSDDKQVYSLYYPGAYDYVKHLCSFLFDESLIPELYKRVKKATLSGLATSKWTIEIDDSPAPVIWWHLVKQKYQSLRGDVSYGKARMAKMFGLPLIGLRQGVESTYKELMKYDDVLFWANILL
jgi:hypothetical protein